MGVFLGQVDENGKNTRKGVNLFHEWSEGNHDFWKKKENKFKGN